MVRLRTIGRPTHEIITADRTLLLQNTAMSKQRIENTVFHLGTCTTCQEIFKQTGLDQRRDFRFREIKTASITPEELDAMKEKTGSYESLFSRRALKYKEMGLKDKVLSEQDYRKLILQEYTFLKRPVVFTHGKIFVGSEKATRAAIAEELKSKK